MNYHTLEDSLEQNNSNENLVTAATPVTNTITTTNINTTTTTAQIPNTSSAAKPRPLRRSLSMQHRAAKVKIAHRAH